MDSSRKKEMVDAYKRKKPLGGIYCIECTGNGKKWVKRTPDLDSIRQRYEFSISINSAPEPSMRAEWDKYGKDSFVFSILETLKRSDEQSDKEYADDLDTLLKMHKNLT